jgi:hypothetical protein
MLVRRFLIAYGPATVADFAAWTNTTSAVARQGFETVRDELVEVDVEGRRSWWLAASLAAASEVDEPGPVVHLLPHFDAYLIGSRPREELVPPELEAIAAERGIRRYDLHSTLPVVLVDGLVAGLWRRGERARTVEITIEPLAESLLRPTPRVEAALRAAAARIGEIVERDARVEIGRVEARPHL